MRRKCYLMQQEKKNNMMNHRDIRKNYKVNVLSYREQRIFNQTVFFITLLILCWFRFNPGVRWYTKKNHLIFLPFRKNLEKIGYGALFKCLSVALV